MANDLAPGGHVVYKNMVDGLSSADSVAMKLILTCKQMTLYVNKYGI